MKYASDFRSIARNALKGRWGIAVIAGTFLLKLGSEEDRYRTAGICALIAGASSTLAAIVNGTSEGAA